MFSRAILKVEPINDLLESFGSAAATAVPFLTFAVLLVLFWVLTEIAFGGYTLGRAVMGLDLSDGTGAPLTRKKRIWRGVRKLSTLGVSGLQVHKLPSYDTKFKIVWYSNLMPPPPAAWELVVQSADGRIKRDRLGNIASFRENGSVKIGRDPNWADLVLSANSHASARHCILRLKGRDMQLLDNGSSNGTYLNGGKVAEKTWISLPNNAQFSAADVKFQINR
jgi:hypothetical protein